MYKILVSSCLIGLPVRYNGEDKKTNALVIARWQREGRLVHICPEIASGFPTPRPPAEIISGNGYDVLAGAALVFENTGRSVGDQYVAGADRALRLALKNQVKVALLTDGSPSCGSSFIYDGTFSGNKISGAGVTTALLEKNGIRVFPDHQIEQANQYLLDMESLLT